MSSSLTQSQQTEIEHLIRTNDCTSRIVCSINVNKSQIDKMKKNLIMHDVVIASSTFMKRSRSLIEEMKTHLLEYIDLHFIKYFDEMC